MAWYLVKAKGQILFTLVNFSRIGILFINTWPHQISIPLLQFTVTLENVWTYQNVWKSYMEKIT